MRLSVFSIKGRGDGEHALVSERGMESEGKAKVSRPGWPNVGLRLAWPNASQRLVWPNEGALPRHRPGPAQFNWANLEYFTRFDFDFGTVFMVFLVFQPCRNYLRSSANFGTLCL